MNLNFMRSAGTAEARAMRITLAYIMVCIIIAALVRFYAGLVYEDDSADEDSGDVVHARFTFDSRYADTRWILAAICAFKPVTLSQ